MKRSRGLRRASGVLARWSFGCLVGLMGVPGVAGAVSLEVHGTDAERTRRVVQQELDRLPSRAEGRIVVSRPKEGEATVVFEGQDGQRLERSIVLQEDAEASAQEVALLAASLVTSEAIFAEQTQPNTADGASGNEPTSPANSQPSSPPSETETSSSETTEHAPTQVDSTQAAPCGTGNEAVLTLGVDFGPALGMSSNARNREAVRVLSLNIVGGMSGGLRGLELGSVLNVQTRFVCGVQISGVVNSVEGPLQGVQVAGAVNIVEGSVSGVQLAGAGSFVDGGVAGVQVAGGVNIVEGAVEGAQLVGGANIVENDVSGIQIAGGGNIVEGNVSGAQLTAGLNIVEGDVRGAQFAGGANIVTGTVRGVQVGVVNVADKSDFSLGLVNINSEGRTHLDAWSVVELGVVAAGLKHGGDHWHSIYGVGTRLSDVELVLVMGLGGHLPLSESLYVDIDALGHGVYRLEGGASDAYLLQGRAVAGWQLSDYVAVFAGPSYNVLLSRRDAPAWEPTYARQAGSSDDPRVHLWPGVVAGVQLLSD